MGEYGPGMTMGRAGELDKERVRHALAGELMCGEDENGFSMMSHFREYVDEMANASCECDDYLYESDLEELHEQADAALREGE